MANSIALVRERPLKPGQPARVYIKLFLDDDAACVFLTTESPGGEPILRIFHYDPRRADNDPFFENQPAIAEIVQLGNLEGSMIDRIEVLKDILDTAMTISPSYLTGFTLPPDQRIGRTSQEWTMAFICALIESDILDQSSWAEALHLMDYPVPPPVRRQAICNHEIL